jgi:hypothetical protein
VAEQERHTFVRRAGTDAESLFVCPEPGCGRRIVLSHVEGDVVVLDAGSGALHQGFSGPVGFSGGFGGDVD